MTLSFCSPASLMTSLCLCSLLKERTCPLFYTRCPFFSCLQTLTFYSENSWSFFSVPFKSASFISALSVFCLNLFSFKYSEDLIFSLCQTSSLIHTQNLWRRNYILSLLTHLCSQWIQSSVVMSFSYSADNLHSFRDTTSFLYLLSYSVYLSESKMLLKVSFWSSASYKQLSRTLI